VKLYKTLRNLLVHPKDKCTLGQTGECVYKIPCHNWSSTYIGETGRSYGKRQGAQKRSGIHQQRNRTMTQADRKDLAAESCIEWSSANILDKVIEKRDNSRHQSVYARRPTTYQWPMTIFWSRTHHQCHVTICLIKFAVGEWNVAIRYRFCVWLCNINIVITVNPTWWMFRNNIKNTCECSSLSSRFTPSASLASCCEIAWLWIMRVAWVFASNSSSVNWLNTSTNHTVQACSDYTAIC